MITEQTDKLSDKDIVTYALYILGGWNRRIHTEDIALKCYELAPSKFSWVKYPQYPDPAPARFALESAKKPKYGALVKGGSERKRSAESIGGWVLTAQGVQWIKVNKSRIEKYLGERVPRGDRLPADRKLKELLKSHAFGRFMSNKESAEISIADFVESLVCTVNTRAAILNDRLDQLDSQAEKLGMPEIKDYVDFCRKKFSSLLGEGGR